MDILAGHPTLVILARGDPARSHMRNEVLLNDLEVFELLIEMTDQQQHVIFQLAFAEIAGYDRGADRDRRNQECAAKDKPADRTAANGMFEDEGGGPVYRHWS